MSIVILLLALWTGVVAVAFMAGCCEAVWHFAAPARIRWQTRPPASPRLRPASAPTLAQLRLA